MSWNTLPGQRLYGVKLGLEEVPKFFLAFNQDAAASYEVKLTDRRLSEASSLIVSHQTQQLSDIMANVKETELVIKNSSNTAAKTDLVTSLKSYRDKLVNEKEALTSEIHLLTSPQNGEQLSTPDVVTIQYELQTLKTITNTITSIDQTIANLENESKTLSP